MRTASSPPATGDTCSKRTGASATITEIRAVAIGARHFFPSCRTVIDIGGQDTKVVQLAPRRDRHQLRDERPLRGGHRAVPRNDGPRARLHYRHLRSPLRGRTTGCGEQPLRRIRESEVISLITKGVKREAIATALHHSIVSRVVSLAKRVGIRDDVVFAGGCAKNPCLTRLFAQRFNKSILTHEMPEMLSAFGAALCAQDS